MNRGVWLAAALLSALAAWRSEGFHQADEHFQILEFAAYKLGMAQPGDLAWEFHERMRPALQPALAYGVYRMVGFGARADPFLVALLLRLLSAAFTLLIARALYRRYRDALRPPYVRLLLFALLFHWIALYQGVRFSSENWSGLTFIAGMLLYPISGDADRYRFLPPGGSSAWGAGVLFGVSFLFRYQMALAVGGFGLWLLFVHREHFSRLAAVIGGGLLVLLVCYPLSYWLYGAWTSPAWNYLASNLIEGKAATYGTRPWYAYLELVFLRGIPPLGLIYVLSFFAFAWRFRRDPLTWAGIAFVLAHSLLARKDVRFLFPLIPLLPVYAAGMLVWMRERYGDFWQHRGWRMVGWLCVITNAFLLLSVLVRPAAMEIAPSRFVYYHYPEGVELSGPHPQLITAEGTTSRFYHRSATRIGPATTVQNPPLPKLWIERTRESPAPPAGAVLLYTDRPDWLEPLNLGHWIDRQKWWYIYAPPAG